MGIEELLARLERDADARVSAIEAAAQQEIDALEAEGDRASTRAREETLAARAAARRARLDRDIAEARQRVNAARLRAQHALFERIIARAKALSADAERDPAYLAALPAALDDALRFFDERGAIVRCRPAIADALRPALEGRTGITIHEASNEAAGFVVVALDGAMELDDTLPARLERLRARLAIELVGEADP